MMNARLSFRDFSIVLALAAVWAFFALASDKFLSPRNLSMLAIELSVTATLALGMLLVLLPGQIDLSAGSGLALVGGTAAVLVYHYHWASPLAMLAALALAVGLWLLMGALIVKQRVPAFIITLGGLLAFKGLFWRVINSSTVPVTTGNESNFFSQLTTFYLPAWVGWAGLAVIAAAWGWSLLGQRARRRAMGLSVADGELAFYQWFIAIQVAVLALIHLRQFRGVPLSLLILGLLAAFVHVLTKHTAFGRHLYAIGGNEEAARLSGIRVERVVIAAFGLMGAVVALTGFLQTAYAGASSTTVGDLMELDAIAACVIGGTSLRGGRGSVMGLLLGSLFMASLLNGMNLRPDLFTPDTKFMARGLVLVLAVWADVRFSRQS